MYKNIVISVLVEIVETTFIKFSELDILKSVYVHGLYDRISKFSSHFRFVYNYV